MFGEAAAVVVIGVWTVVVAGVAYVLTRLGRRRHGHEHDPHTW